MDQELFYLKILISQIRNRHMGGGRADHPEKQNRPRRRVRYHYWPGITLFSVRGMGTGSPIYGLSILNAIFATQGVSAKLFFDNSRWLFKEIPACQ